MTKIQWTDATWNPVTGCSYVSQGCKHCYAAAMSRRLEAMGQDKYAGVNGPRHFNGKVKLHPNELDKPLRWKKPRRVFVCSMSDLYHDDVTLEFGDRVFDVMARCPQHTFQVLTKRPDNMATHRANQAVLPNVWLGTSVEDQNATYRIRYLLRCPAAVRFLSCEPLLGPLAIYAAMKRIDWVIVGGESGPGARWMDPDWSRGVRDQCREAGTAFFMKQMSRREPIPEDLFIRQFPTGAVSE